MIRKVSKYDHANLLFCFVNGFQFKDLAYLQFEILMYKSYW